MKSIHIVLYGSASSALEEEFCAKPGLRKSDDDQCDGVPVRAQVAVPRGDGTESGQNNADASADESVTHGAVGSQPCSDVATDDAEDNSIGRGKEKGLAGSVLA